MLSKVSFSARISILPLRVDTILEATAEIESFEAPTQEEIIDYGTLLINNLLRENTTIDIMVLP